MKLHFEILFVLEGSMLKIVVESRPCPRNRDLVQVHLLCFCPQPIVVVVTRTFSVFYHY